MVHRPPFAKLIKVFKDHFSIYSWNWSRKIFEIQNSVNNWYSNNIKIRKYRKLKLLMSAIVENNLMQLACNKHSKTENLNFFYSILSFVGSQLEEPREKTLGSKCCTHIHLLKTILLRYNTRYTILNTQLDEFLCIDTTV